MTSVLKRLSPFILIAVVAFIGCRKDHFNFNDLPPTVKGYFTVDEPAFDVDEQIHFSNKSEDATSYRWDFGDGTSSTEKDPVKSFGQPGVYRVTLKAYGPGGTGSYTQMIRIRGNDVNSDKVLYYIDDEEGRIMSDSLKTGASSILIADIAGKGGVGIVLDSVNNKIYFSDFAKTPYGRIWRMNLDGTNLESLVSDINDPYSVAINIEDGKIYWADNSGNISRANLDGSGLEREFIHIADGQMRGIAFDSKNKIIYFYEVNNEDLYAAKADGTGVGKIISGTYGYSILVDEVNGKIYYDDQRGDCISQANLDGSNITKITDSDSRIYGMAIDYDSKKFYWSSTSDGSINRCNFDGSSPEPYITDLSSPRGIFIK